MTLAAEVVRRAIERGEVPSTIDADLVATVFVGTLRLQVVERGIDPPDGWFDAVVDVTLRAAGAT